MGKNLNLTFEILSIPFVIVSTKWFLLSSISEINSYVITSIDSKIFEHLIFVDTLLNSITTKLLILKINLQFY